MEIKQLIYIATERCNYRCKTCTPMIYDSKKDKEITSSELIRIFNNSELIKKVKYISITGGEPFLKDDIVDFILELEKVGIKCNITSNGSFSEKISLLIDKIKSTESISFAISIDGIEATHDEIRSTKGGYEKAIKTVKLLKEKGIKVMVNTVLQESNYNEIVFMNNFFKELGVSQNLIPKLSCDTIPFSYSDEEIRTIIPFMGNKWDKKYILSKGDFKVKSCHAAKNSCIIDPYGQIYACLTGYKYLNKNDQFLIGDLKFSKFDDILKSSKSADVYNDVVHKCNGCYNSCEVTREVLNFGLNCSLTKSEIFRASEFIRSSSNMDSIMIDLETFHDLENSQEGYFRWMSNEISTVYLKATDEKPKYIEFEYINALRDGMVLYVIIGSIVLKEISCFLGRNIEKVEIPQDILLDQITEIKFKVSKTWRPSEYFGGDDSRTLGVGLSYVKYLNYLNI